MKIRSVLQSRVAPCGQMEEQDEANSRFSQFFLSNFTKIRSVGAELLHADRWTNKTKPTAVFRNFCEYPCVRPSVSMDTDKTFYYTNLENMA